VIKGNMSKIYITIIMILFISLSVSCGDENGRVSQSDLDKELDQLSRDSNDKVGEALTKDKSENNFTTLELGYIRDLRIIPQITYRTEEPHVKGRIIRHRDEISNIIKKKLADEGIEKKEDLTSKKKQLEEQIKTLINEFLNDKYQNNEDNIKAFSLSDL
jgi:hypothetical protein